MGNLKVYYKIHIFKMLNSFYTKLLLQVVKISSAFFQKGSWGGTSKPNILYIPES